jgi:hypothetical protein
LFMVVAARAYWTAAGEGHAADDLVPPDVAYDEATMYLHPTWDYPRAI